jgi:phosphoglycerate dehydrogenase-like enzyme
MTRVAILDDYAKAALELADWSSVKARAEVVVFDRHLEGAVLVEALQGFEVACTLRERATLDASAIEGLPGLKLIVVTDLRVTTIDFEAAEKAGVRVCEARPPADVLGAPSATAELTWALILAMARDLPFQAGRLRAGLWQDRLGIALAGLTIGIVGLGRVGRRVAGYARAFDMRVLAWSEHLDAVTAEQAGATLVSKHRLFAESDVASVHYVLSPRSRGLVGADEIAAMKPGAFLVNTSRGPIIDAAALVEALATRRIAGAALDVFDEEPLPPDHPLRQLDNVLMTPHLGFATVGGLAPFYAGMAATVAAYLEKPVQVK